MEGGKVEEGGWVYYIVGLAMAFGMVDCCMGMFDDNVLAFVHAVDGKFSLDTIYFDPGRDLVGLYS